VNYTFPGNGNLPHGCTQADIDAAFGVSLSDDAEDALTVHDKIQNMRFLLLEEIMSHPYTMCIDVYDDLEAALIDASFSNEQLESRMLQIEADKREAAKVDAAEARRDGGW
jgi:hypothetical protein